MGYVGMFFFARHVGMLVVFRLVNSLSFAVGFTVNAALAFEFLPREKHTSGIALFGISGILSNPIAVFVADRVVALASERMVFVVAALFALMALVTMIPMREGRQEIREDGHFFAGYRARIRNHGHSCFLCEIVIRSQFHTTYEPEA
jgi:hypothetical protein